MDKKLQTVPPGVDWETYKVVDIHYATCMVPHFTAHGDTEEIAEHNLCVRLREYIMTLHSIWTLEFDDADHEKYIYTTID